ncbi:MULTISPECIES: hypothetical protein [unclassified Microbulbifer]|uniref:hypothetical protein n=1 Tax=unclassified Microbulbifer TaxID=2619833 RepID=UPI0027E495A5|nr:MULTISPECIES: hypothetical protein [unclassified Microbulbifer]
MKYLLSAVVLALVGALLLTAEFGQQQAPAPATAKEKPGEADRPASLSGEPTPQQLARDQPKVQSQSLDDQSGQERSLLHRQIVELANCHQTYSCPQDLSDPRASDILQGKMLAEKLRAYADFHRENDYFDEESAEMARAFLDHPDGFVQEAAIDLMSMQAPNRDNALVLIEALKSSYDARIVNQAMKELQRYPDLQPQVDQLLSQSLQTGSLFVAQEMALNILPHLSPQNLQAFEEVAEKLPQNSLRVKALKSNLREFRLRQSGG